MEDEEVNEEVVEPKKDRKRGPKRDQQGQGHQYQQGQYGSWGWYYWPAYQGYQKPKPRRSSKPAIAGALLVTAGLLAIVMGGLFGTMFFTFGESGMFDSENWEDGVGGVQGYVIYQNASPVVGATITVVDSGQVAISNDTGYYRLIGAPSGWQDLKVEKEGYKTILQSVYIKNQGTWAEYDWGDESTADFQLQEGVGTIRIGPTHDVDDDWERKGMKAMENMVYVCMGTTIIFGAIAVIGGYLAFHRRHFPVVMVSSIFGMLSLGFGIGSILSIVALIVLLLSHNEFDVKKGSSGKIRKKGKRKGRGGSGRNRHVGQPVGGIDGNAPTTRGPYSMAYYNQYYQQPVYSQQGPRTY